MQVLRNSRKTMKIWKFQGIQDGGQAPQALASLRILAKDRVILKFHPNWRQDQPLVEHRHPRGGPEAGVSVPEFSRLGVSRLKNLSPRQDA